MDFFRYSRCFHIFVDYGLKLVQLPTDRPTGSLGKDVAGAFARETGQAPCSEAIGGSG